MWITSMPSQDPQLPWMQQVGQGTWLFYARLWPYTSWNWKNRTRPSWPPTKRVTNLLMWTSSHCCLFSLWIEKIGFQLPSCRCVWPNPMWRRRNCFSREFFCPNFLPHIPHKSSSDKWQGDKWHTAGSQVLISQLRWKHISGQFIDTLSVWIQTPRITDSM